MTVPSNDFPFIRIGGAPFERGKLYGSAAAEQIRNGLAIYSPAFAAQGVEWSEVRRRSAKFAEQIEAWDSGLLRELEGIGAGAGMPVEDIIVLNARTELLYGVSDKTDGCTGAVILPEATANGDVLHGQNWDWRADCLGSTIVLHVEPDEGPTILTLVEAGGLARCGLNSAGVAVTGNFLKCEHDHGRGAIPLSLLRRKILQQRVIGDAMAAVFDTSVSFSNNVMLSTADGFAVDLEKTPVETHWIEPEKGMIVHSNHFLSASARAKVKDLGITTTPDTLYRNRRVEAILAAAAPAVTIEDMKAAFADEFGRPFSVCRPPVASGNGPEMSTVATVIMNVTAGELHVAAAPYLGAAYSQYVIGS